MSDLHSRQYLDVVQRVSDLVGSGAGLDAMVPACPEWSARAVIAHLAGLAEDWADGRLDGYGSEAWTAAQIERFEGIPVETVLARWAEAAPTVAAMSQSPLGGTPSMWAFGDAVVHEADLRPVLEPGSRVPAEPTALGLKAGVARWRRHLADHGAPPLLVEVTGGRVWPIGDTDGGEVCRVQTSEYELFRALFGRRSRDQVAAWSWSREPDAYLDVGLPSPFDWAEQPLDD